METLPERREFAWQPLTPRGVAAFAGASLGRLLLVQFVVAILVALTVVWFVRGAWFPSVSEAVRRLPPEGVIASGRLEWRGDSPMSLAEGRYLALTVDLNHEGKARSPAHVLVEFGRDDFRISSLFGYVVCAYPKGRVLAFNREDLVPRWGAWAPPVLAVTVGLVITAIILTWALLATIYCLPAWLVALYADRELDLRASWRLAGAALMPGALLLTATILFYGLGVLDVVHLVVAGALHLLLGWIYVVVSPFYLPRDAAAQPRANPFNRTTRGADKKPHT